MVYTSDSSGICLVSAIQFWGMLCLISLCAVENTGGGMSAFQLFVTVTWSLSSRSGNNQLIILGNRCGGILLDMALPIVICSSSVVRSLRIGYK